jgi:hypothetical protein
VILLDGERLSDGGSILDSDDVSVVDNLLRCGQWKEDNGQLTRHLVKKCRRSGDSSEGGIRRGEELNDQGPVVIPLVSMQEDRFLDLQVRSGSFIFTTMFEFYHSVYFAYYYSLTVTDQCI